MFALRHRFDHYVSVSFLGRGNPFSSAYSTTSGCGGIVGWSAICTESYILMGLIASTLCDILRVAMLFYEYIYPLPNLSVSIQAIHRSTKSPSNTFSLRRERLVLSSCPTQPSNNQPDHHAQTRQNCSASPFGRHCDAAVPRDRDLRFYHGDRANLRDKRPKGCHGAIRRQGLGELRFPNLHLISRR